jgi:hypothetical protein
MTPATRRVPPAALVTHSQRHSAASTTACASSPVFSRGQKATGILLEDYRMPRPTATRWLRTARRRGILREDHQEKPGMTRERRERLHRERAAKQWNKLTAELANEQAGD